ncbi:hypothetical protein K2173_002439 [Erythroxylum novogranatense]|uniref:Stomatal closure-related actin-binding protein coiled-coil domain-containing protein n=1 Tax=Erythroxylum novogranatense TaxID=1862640 RepID=A0AAV8T9Q4_9ROSI|nr:hypothetical protein K2173_002439 [Erythroxylum novogranatense]
MKLRSGLIGRNSTPGFGVVSLTLHQAFRQMVWLRRILLANQRWIMGFLDNAPFRTTSIACEKVKNTSELSNGYNVVGLSQDLEELMEEVQKARRIKMLHKPSKVFIGMAIDNKISFELQNHFIL